MAVLIHERPDGELVVSECDWLDGVQSFERILEEHYGDSEHVPLPVEGWMATRGFTGYPAFRF